MRERTIRNALTAKDVLAGLAVFYLAAVPEREGALVREAHASFEAEGFQWSWPGRVGSRDELRALVTWEA